MQLHMMQSAEGRRIMQVEPTVLEEDPFQEERSGETSISQESPQILGTLGKV